MKQGRNEGCDGFPAWFAPTGIDCGPDQLSVSSSVFDTGPFNSAPVRETALSTFFGSSWSVLWRFTMNSFIILLVYELVD